MRKLFTAITIGLVLGYAITLSFVLGYILTHNNGVTITTAPAHKVSTPVVQPQETRP